MIESLLQYVQLDMPEHLTKRNFRNLLLLLLLSHIVTYGIFSIVEIWCNEEIVFNIFKVIDIHCALALFWLGILVILFFRTILVYILTPSLFYKYMLIPKIVYQGLKFAALGFPLFSLLVLVVGNSMIINTLHISVSIDKLYSLALFSTFMIILLWVFIFSGTIKTYIQESFVLNKYRALFVNLLASLLATTFAGYLSFGFIVNGLIDKQKLIYTIINIEKAYGIIDSCQYNSALENIEMYINALNSINTNGNLNACKSNNK